MAKGKGYDAEEAEKKWQNYWEKEKIYKFDSKSKKKIYSIDTPPPYASAGHLHVGHALSYTQFEIIARIMRQLGFNVYFPPGYDDNGLPTEKYVEEKLGIDKNKVNREEFRRICLKESKKAEDIYTNNVFKKLGHSYDWDLLYQTISPESQKVAQTAFLKLIKKGDCYRAREPVIWCTKHETALAQAEVEDLARKTKLNYIDFNIENSNEKVTIATTRPELLSSCVGVFVNPKDKRYKNLVGKSLNVPLFNYDVKVMEDEKVDIDFGTGIVMVCTFGDNTDIEWWKKHKLELKISINEKGKLNEKAGKYAGLGLKEAREKIIEDLEKEGRLKKQEELEQTVGSCWRCSTPVEYLVKEQWFIKTLSYKKQLLQYGKKVKWHPDFMRIRYENWVQNLGWDWCISRQRYYGIPIPVWYCDNCKEIILPKEAELPVDPTIVKKKCDKCGKDARADTDVFDTWMTSSNSPEVACRWLEKQDLYKKLVPMNLRPQSHDIIRTWAFYTILKSFLLFKRIPWKDITINTFVLDDKGKGMSKSKGNVVWADELLKRFNVDAFRYWVGTASLGSDLPFKEQDLVAGSRFLTKLWNASKFVLMNLKNYKLKKPKKIEVIDKWMLDKTSNLVEEVKKLYLDYNIAEGKRKVENFFWKDFADNYLEIVKNRVYNGSKEEKESAFFTLYSSLLAILKLIAPIMPHITEEIYHMKFAKDEQCKSIHISKWPDLKFKDKKSKEVGDLLVKIVSKVRQEKAKKQKSVKAEIILTLDKKDKSKLKGVAGDLGAVLNSKQIKEGKFKVEFV